MLSGGAAMIWLLVLLFLAGSASWGRQDRSSSADDPDPAPEVIQISGNEHLTWDQVAASVSEVKTFRYVVYVDGIPADLPDVSCSTAPMGEAGFVCSARLPPLAAGTHDIAVSAYVDQDDWPTSPASSPVRVRLAPTTIQALTSGFGNESFVTVDGIRLRATAVTSGLADPTDLAMLPDGRVLIAERQGRVRVFRDGVLLSSPALTLIDASTAGAGGLLALAVDREFETTHAVYVVYTTSSGLRLARFFESNNTLSGRAILLDGLPISDLRPKATLKMGPDGKLYLGLDDGGDIDNIGDLGSYSGKVLRLNKDGTAPQDQAAGTPIFATGLGRPTGMSWSENGPTLWLTGTDRDGSHQLRGFAVGPRNRHGATVRRYALPSGIAESNLAIYQSNVIPAFSGNMLIADAMSRSILRVRFDRSGAIAETEWLFRGGFDSIKAISVAPDGSLYVSTGDQLVRIIPEG